MGSAPQALEIRVLGPFSVAVDGTLVPAERWQRLQAKTLVKLLALAPNHRLHREVLMDMLWPDAAPALAANNLNKVIHSARRSLEPALARGPDSVFIVTREHQICLEAPGRLSVDAAAFEQLAAEGLATQDPARLEAALELYRGEPLEEDRYDERFERHRSRLRAVYIDVLRALAALLGASGELDRSVALLQILVEQEPLDEPAVRRLMSGLAAAGRRNQVAHIYEAFRGRLREALGVEPEAETRRLLDRIFGTEPPTLASRVDERASTGAGASARGANTVRRLTRFIGRENSVASVSDLVQNERLVTLTGTGGIGKTRLALEVCQAVADAYPGGVWIIELASLEDPALVDATVAAALELPSRRDATLAEAVLATIGEHRALLLFDNCEHVVASTAAVIAELLAAAVHIHVLATSREALGVEGETVWRVLPMTLPTPASPPAPAELSDFEATALFLDRLRLRDPAFPLTHANADAIARLCHRLDGLPLAIEIAAASAATLGLDQVAGRLDRILTLEKGVRSPAPRRHRTLKALMDWSYELLAPEERVLLRRLSVFAGGFTLEAAEGVCAGEGLAARDVPALLARLVERSLVSSDVHGEQARFGLLETVRLYADEKCSVEDDRERLRRSHARWYAAFAEEAEPELRGQHRRFALARLDAERDNLWTALRWGLSDPAGEPGTSVRLCAVLWLWMQRTQLNEGRAWLEAALAASGGAPPGIRAGVLHGLGNYCQLQGDLDRSAELLEESVGLWRRTGDRSGLVRSLQTLGAISAVRGEYDRAHHLQLEAAELCHTLDDSFCAAQVSFARGVLAIYAEEFGDARGFLEDALAGYRALDMRGNEMAAVHNLAEIALLTGELDAAERLAHESLDLSRRYGEQFVAAHSIRVLGDVAARRGAVADARDLLRQAMDLHRAQRDRLGMIHVLESLARLTSDEGAFDEALRMLGAAESARDRHGLRVHPYERTILDGWAREASRRVGPDLARAARERGRSMALETAVHAAFG
jgi:predicted ATPase/DNA-binding SARP family transcriptional activator